MLCARLVLLAGVVCLVKAKSLTSTFGEELTIDDFEKILLDNLGEPMVSELTRERRDADEQPNKRPPCELRPLFLTPIVHNHTARKECFERWEEPALEAKGVNVSSEGLRIMSDRSLMVNKGCDVQCMFWRTGLLVEDGESFTVSKEGVMALQKQDDDPQEFLDIFEQQIDKCMEDLAELVHPKQSCKSGADEFYACLRFNVEKSCPGAKWKSNKSCDEAEDAWEKRRICSQESLRKLLSQLHSHTKQNDHKVE